MPARPPSFLLRLVPLVKTIHDRIKSMQSTRTTRPGRTSSPWRPGGGVGKKVGPALDLIEPDPVHQVGQMIIDPVLLTGGPAAVRLKAITDLNLLDKVRTAPPPLTPEEALSQGYIKSTSGVDNPFATSFLVSMPQ